MRRGRPPKSGRPYYNWDYVPVVMDIRSAAFITGRPLYTIRQHCRDELLKGKKQGRE